MSPTVFFVLTVAISRTWTASDDPGRERSRVGSPKSLQFQTGRKPARSHRRPQTLKTRTLKLDDLQDFVACYYAENRHERKKTERFKYFSHAELMARDKASLDIFWLKDDSLENLDDLPPPAILWQEIIDHLEAALASFRDVAAGLQQR